jgi:hypothetical protein
MRPRGEERHDLGDEARQRGGPLFLRPHLVRHAEDGEPLRVQRLEIDLGTHDAVDVADRREPSLEGERAQALGEQRAADGVDDDVGAAAPVAAMTAGAKSGSRVQSATSRPSALSALSFPAEPDVPMTCAPSALPSCSEATPTPDDTPLTRSQSPACRRPCRTSMSKATRKVSGMLAASSQESAGGTLIASAASMSANSAKHRGSGPSRDRPAGSRRRPARRRRPRPRPPCRSPSIGRLAVQAVTEQELAAVERGGAHPDEKLLCAATGTGTSRSSSAVSVSDIVIQ